MEAANIKRLKDREGSQAQADVYRAAVGNRALKDVIENQL
jgi:hypothetical protein